MTELTIRCTVRCKINSTREKIMMNHQKAQEEFTTLVENYFEHVKDLFNQGDFPDEYEHEEWVEDFIAYLELKNLR